MTACDAVVIGASSGALRALRAILPSLPSHLPAAVVVHVSPDQPSLLPAVLAPYVDIRRPLKEAEDKEPFLPGSIYLAPPGYHLLIERQRTLALSQDEPVWFCRPAIDVLFESARDVFGARTLAVLLTGANEDGAAGLAAIGEAGGTTWVQDPQEAECATMPAAALARRAPTQILSLTQIAARLAELAP